uniref:Protein 60A n=2 Tax=Culex pipiens TaxID=7175 RepID=A0A8D7ZVE9_CULPI
MHCFFISIFLINVAYVLCALSGFYVDDGVGQTVIERLMTNDDQQVIEHEILDLLGLSKRPRKRHSHSSMSKSAPQFLLNVYDKLSAEANNAHTRHVRSTEDKIIFTEADDRAIDQSDIIMTFLNENHHVSEVRHEKGRRLWFDLSKVDENMQIILAELRLYQLNQKNKYKKSNESMSLAVYSIMNIDGEKDLIKISETDISTNRDGWIEINVTSVVELWKMQKISNNGFYIGAYYKSRPEKEIKIDEIGLVKGDDKYQPFLVAYCTGTEKMKSVNNDHQRIKRNIQRKRKNKSENRNPLLEQPHDLQKSCQIKTMYVSFKALNWQDWIIAPEGYGAYFCSGECNFPLNAHMNATNHAIVQTLVHLMHPGKVPKPCCAPTKLIPISVLYHIDESNVNLKKYKNMVVKSCGCH